MDDKLMMIHKITLFNGVKLVVKSLNTQLIKPTKQNSLECIRIRYYKTLGTSVIKRQLFPIQLLIW